MTYCLADCFGTCAVLVQNIWSKYGDNVPNRILFHHCMVDTSVGSHKCDNIFGAKICGVHTSLENFTCVVAPQSHISKQQLLLLLLPFDKGFF
jgi:hypothetical protein